MKCPGAFSPKITINGRFLSQATTGVQRYALEMLTALDILLATGAVEPVPVTVLTPHNHTRLPLWSSLRIQTVGRFTGQLWEQVDLPIHARGTMLFTPCGGAPILHQEHVITIHDAGPFHTPEAYTAAYRIYYKNLQRILAKRVRHIITVSEFSRQELMRCLHVSESKISRTWLSGRHILRHTPDPTVLERNNLLPGRYILAVGSRN